VHGALQWLTCAAPLRKGEVDSWIAANQQILRRAPLLFATLALIR